MLNSSGQLILCNIHDNIQLILANNVEQYWIANYISATSGNSHLQDSSSGSTENIEPGSNNEFENTLWAYGQDGLQVWFPFFTSSVLPTTKITKSSSAMNISIGGSNTTGSSKLLSREKSLEFDLEVYPIGFIPELGVIIGLTQEVSLSNNSAYISLPITSQINKSKLHDSLSVANVYFPSFDLKIKVNLNYN